MGCGSLRTVYEPIIQKWSTNPRGRNRKRGGRGTAARFMPSIDGLEDHPAFGVL